MQAKWIGYITDKTFDESDCFILHGAAAPYLRKKFNLKNGIKKARLEITALGIFKAFINGKPVGNEFFAPGWTNYNKRIILKTYDITDLLEKNNAISVVLGDGWYAGYLCILGRNRYGKYPLELYVKITVEYDNGNTEEIITDESWLGGTGAIKENDFLFGEVFDARLPHAECSLYDFDDSLWKKASVCSDKSEKLTVFDCEPVKIVGELIPECISERENVSVYDFKQNFAGTIRIKCKGERGAKIIMRHGEMLNADKTLYVENLRRAKATDTYILKGDGEEENMPTFTYHGFQYAEITTVGNVEISSVIGCVLSSDLKTLGYVETSNHLVNRLFSNIIWSQKSNFVELPTDCPQRNERLGWSGDAQVFSRTGMYNADAEKFYKKQLMRIDDDRRGGEIPDVVPFFGVAPFDSCGWRDVAVVLPYNLWQMYGNTEVIVQYKSMLEDFVERQLSTMDNYIWKDAYYGDWLNVDEETDSDVLATSMQAVSMRMIAEMFKVVGFDCDKYYKIYDSIKKAYRAAFVDKNGRIKGESQAAYAIAYYAGLIDEMETKNNIYKAFENKNFHIHSGFVSIRFILPVLCEIGLKDIAYRLLTNETYPSWGYSIVNGATTLWERWNSYTIKDGFADKAMNSFNHYSLGSCGEWFYEYMLGIKPLAPAFRRVRIKPYIDGTGKITSAKGYYNSRNGKISVEWSVNNGVAEIIVEKPKSMPAEFCFDNVKEIVQDGKKADAFNESAGLTRIIVNL